MFEDSYLKELIKKSKIFKFGVLNIFTDASTKRMEPHSWRACAGAVGVALNPKGNQISFKYQDSRMLIDKCTNNIAELAGIELGVDMAIKYQDKFDRINLFSDSNISVHTFCEWIFYWCRNIGSYNHPERMQDLRTSSGKSVMNLTHILDIINKICSIDQAEFNMYHCRGHHMGKLNEMIQSFYKENKIDISREDAMLLANFNDVVDRDTRLIVERYFDASEYESRRQEYPHYAIAPMNMKKYARIIGRRGF